MGIILKMILAYWQLEHYSYIPIIDVKSTFQNGRKNFNPNMNHSYESKHISYTNCWPQSIAN